MTPLHSQVLVKVLPNEKKTASGILLMKDDSTTYRGLVVAVGAGRYENGVLIPMTVKENDIVVFSKFNQYPTVQHNDENHFMIHESGLLAIEYKII